MSAFFVDTSALAKRYLAETGSAWVRSWILPRTGNVTIITRLASALQAMRTLSISLTFVTADTRLLAAASAEGLAVDDPNAHP